MLIFVGFEFIDALLFSQFKLLENAILKIVSKLDLIV